MYCYEMHCHTSESSKCGRIGPAELVDFYRGAGYSGVVITDHFLNGNTTVPRDLPWAERVKLFTKSYRKAKERGDEIGMPVFFGFEFSGQESDFLTYGLDEQWLLEHEDCDRMNIPEYCNLVHESGGFVTHAHPFYGGKYISLFPKYVDAVEIFNAGKPDFANEMAKQYAENYGLNVSCGSDNHRGAMPRLAALCFEEEQTDIHMLIESMLAKKQTIRQIQCAEESE